MEKVARWIVFTAGIVLGYFALGKFGLALALPPGFVSAIWPAAGFAFAAVVLWGAAITWPGILLGSMMTNATVGGGFHLDSVAVGIAFGSTLQAMVGGSRIKSMMPDMELNDPRKVMRFSLIGIASCLIAATVGNLTLLAHGYISLAQVPQSFVTWWLGNAFGVQIFAPLALVIWVPNAMWKQRRLSVGLPLIVAFGLSGAIYYFVRESEERQLLRSFVASTESFNHALASLERHNGQALRQLAASYSLRGETPGAEFASVSAEIHKTLPTFRAISWVPVLDAKGRLNHDRRALADPALPAVRWPAGFAPSVDGMVAPVEQIYPLQGNETALGVDLLGEPLRAQAIRHATASGQLTMTSPLRLAQDPTGPGAVLLIAPVKTPAGQGVISGVLDLRLIDKALQAIPGVVWELREVVGRAEHTIWKSSASTMPEFAAATFLDRAGVYSQQTLKLGGREWRILLHMPHARLVADASNSSLLVLMLALLACGVVVSFSLIRTGEHERIAAEVGEKTAALNAEIVERKAYQVALEQSKVVAESANLAKSQFLATMSHEIRTPMNGILGMAQLLMMDELSDAKRKEFVRAILGSGKSLLVILNDILDLSKIEAGKMELTASPFDASALVEEVAALFHESAKAKGIAVVARDDTGGSRYIGDPIRLRQMLSNYVGNAIKFSDGGTITITLKEDLDTEGAVALEFSVSDQGIGIEQSKVSELFEPFTQADASASRRFGGTGLGLSIVRRLAQQMHGEVGVESHAGQGSRFWFTVRCPRMAHDAETRKLTREPVDAPVTDTPPAQKGWILVVDDNAINRMVAQNMLAKLGVSVRFAENGQQALDVLLDHAAEPPDMVLMDCQMPVMDGYAATEAIRHIEQTTGAPRLHIVAVTAGAFDSDRALSLAAGMDDYLAKPIAFDELKRLVHPKPV